MHRSFSSTFHCTKVSVDAYRRAPGLQENALKFFRMLPMEAEEGSKAISTTYLEKRKLKVSNALPIVELQGHSRRGNHHENRSQSRTASSTGNYGRQRKKCTRFEQLGGKPLRGRSGAAFRHARAGASSDGASRPASRNSTGTSAGFAAGRRERALSSEFATASRRDGGAYGRRRSLIVGSKAGRHSRWIAPISQPMGFVRFCRRPLPLHPQEESLLLRTLKTRGGGASRRKSEAAINYPTI